MGTEIAVVLTSLGTLLAAVFAGLRELRKDKASKAEMESARAMADQRTLIDSLQDELARVQKEFADARAEWRTERIELRAEIQELKQRVKELEK